MIRGARRLFRFCKLQPVQEQQKKQPTNLNLK